MVALTLAGCGETAETGEPGQPEGWDDELRLREASDTNVDAGIVEVALTARVAEIEIASGTTTKAWTYDGGLPGPLIRAKRGDRVIVHFTNQLPEPTTIHWHGVRVPIEMDGVPDGPKPAVQPGESFDYDFVVPDAGLFWYHPHVDSAAQVGNGLYGALLVEDPDEPAGLGDEVVMVLSDIALGDDGALLSPEAGGALGGVFGREGNKLLVNGRVRPVLRPRAGMRERWRIVNAAKSRYFWLDLEGTKLSRIGGDGGRMPVAEELERVLLSPGERADVLVTPVDAPAQERVLRWVPFDRGYGTSELRPIEDVLAIAASADTPASSGPAPDASRAIVPIDVTGATPVAIKLTMEQIGDEIRLGINGVPFDESEPLHGAVGETQVWTVENAMPWGHPFHLHGFFFQVLDQQMLGEAATVPPLEWKDTVRVPVDGKLRLAVRYDARPGMWMFHCHILDHADLGMMGMLDLEM